MPIINRSTVADEVQGERVVEEAPYLQFPIKEKDFGRFAKTMENKCRVFWDGDFNLKKRQEKIRDYWRGKQLENTPLYPWQTPYIDNIVFRNTETHISNALGRMPDIIVIPANKTEQSKELARALKQALEIKLLDPVEMRHKLRMSSRHLFVYLFGCLKYRWDETIGKNGDFIIEWIHPDNLLLDSTTYLDGNPRVIFHYQEATIKQLQNEFPKKKDDLWKRFGIKMGTEKQLNTVIRYKELWFTWYGEDGKPMEGIGKLYDENLIFEVKKNPNWDYEGEEREGEETELDVETGQEVPVMEEYYHNHLDNQEKPFVFLNFLNLGKHLIDDTSLPEQILYMQDNVNKRGRQITDAAATANGKWAFSSDYIKKSEAEKVTDDPGEHIWGKGRVQDGLHRFPAQGPDATLFAALSDARESTDDTFGIHPTLRGKKETDVATTSSLLREGDTTRIDDFVAEALTRAMGKLVNAAVHMMKVNYTETHYIKDAGTDGEFIFLEMSRDKIEDGIVAKVKASTSDKRIQRAEAIELAKARMIDPMSLYEKTDEPNPKEMTKRLVLSTSNSLAYLEEIMGEGGMPDDLIKKLGGSVDQQAISDIQLLQQGEQPNLPQQVTPEYLAAFANFMESPEFEQLDPIAKTRFVTFVDQLKELAKGGGQAPVV